MNFDPQSAQRIARVVRAAERFGGNGPPPPTPVAGGSPSWYAMLIGESAGTPGLYSWKVVDRQDGSWVARSPLQLDSTCSAAEMNGATGIVGGTVVKMERGGTTSTASPTDGSPAAPSVGTSGVDMKATGSPFPTYLFTVGLPPGGSPRMVIQRDDNMHVVWGWVLTADATDGDDEGGE